MLWDNEKASCGSQNSTQIGGIKLSTRSLENRKACLFSSPFRRAEWHRLFRRIPPASANSLGLRRASPPPAFLFAAARGLASHHFCIARNIYRFPPHKCGRARRARPWTPHMAPNRVLVGAACPAREEMNTARPASAARSKGSSDRINRQLAVTLTAIASSQSVPVRHGRAA